MNRLFSDDRKNIKVKKVEFHEKKKKVVTPGIKRRNSLQII